MCHNGLVDLGLSRQERWTLWRLQIAPSQRSHYDIYIKIYRQLNSVKESDP